jgi:transglutaminase-like putative cysteine protease
METGANDVLVVKPDSGSFDDNERLIPYENTGRLDAITIAQRSRSEEIALRAFSKSQPGYLRGQAYDVFAEGHWRRAGYGVNSRVIRPIVQMAADGPKPLRDYVAAGRYRSGERAFNLETETAITTAKPPWRVIEIRNDSLRGRRYFTPLGASYAQGVSQGRLTVDSNGIIQMGLSTESRYRIYVGEGGKVSLTASHAQMLTSTPPSSQSQFIRRRAQQIAGDQATAVDKINAIEDYCQANYQLSAASPVIPIPKKNDRLTYFLLNEPPATCEYFASAAVVLLREVGVPSRYVTGFVVSDRGRAQDYWEARNRNAHAWVEAYDDLAQQWITVEPTPGMRRNKGRRGRGGNWQ